MSQQIKNKARYEKIVNYMEKLGFTMTSDDWAGEGEAVQFNPPFYVKAPNGKKVECQFKYNWYYDEFFVLGDYWAGDLYENDEPTGIPTIQTMIDKLATYGFHDLYVDDWNDINSLLYINDFKDEISCSHENLSIKTMEVLNGELLLTLDCDKCGKRTSTSASLNQGWEAEDLNTWAQQELSSHGKNVSFKDFIKKEIKSHGNIDIVDWAKHEKQSHTKKYGAEYENIGTMQSSPASGYNGYMNMMSSARRMVEIGNETGLDQKLGEAYQDESGRWFLPILERRASESFSLDSKKADSINMEEPVIEEPSFIPDGDGRAIGQQNSSINLSPLHAETFGAEIGGEVGLEQLKSPEVKSIMKKHGIKIVNREMIERVAWGRTNDDDVDYVTFSGSRKGLEQLADIIFEGDLKDTIRNAESFNASMTNTDLLEWCEDYLWKNDKKGYQAYHEVRRSYGFDAESRFDNLSNEIAEEYEEKGKSPEEAERIGDATAAMIGRKKYGKKGMAQMSKKGMSEAESGNLVDINYDAKIRLKNPKDAKYITPSIEDGMDFGEGEGVLSSNAKIDMNTRWSAEGDAATYSPSSSPDMVNEIQTSPTNESPQLFNASNTFNVTSALGISGLVVAALSLPMLYSSAKSRLGKSAEEKRKASGSVRRNHTQVKNSEYSVGQVNPVEAEGQQDIHGAEGITNPRHAPSASPAGYPSKSLKMW